jgi:hypothetical protein
MDDVSGLVSHDLSLDVSRLEDQLLDEDAAVAESLLGLRPGQSREMKIKSPLNYFSLGTNAIKFYTTLIYERV